MKKLLFIFSAIAILSSCKKDDDKPGGGDPHEEELITTVKLRFENIANTNDTVCASFIDTDGDGGNDPSQFDTITLDVGTTYVLNISLLNESDPAAVEDITTEVEEEGLEHQFFFDGTALSMNHISLTYADADSLGNPIGLVDTVEVLSSMSNMTFGVTLRHEPDKTATDVSSGDITNAGGETDIELDFIMDLIN